MFTGSQSPIGSPYSRTGHVPEKWAAEECSLPVHRQRHPVDVQICGGGGACTQAPVTTLYTGPVAHASLLHP